MAKVMAHADPPAKRGTTANPENRYERIHVDDEVEDDGTPPTVFYRDSTRTALARNDSPDIGFQFSLNPYRGCEHGCIYCYARPSHEYLSFSAGLDFERRILVKDEAANPSGSFKDRRASLSVHEARQRGYRGVAAATSGNYGAAVASQAAKAGLACIVVQEAFDSRGVAQPEIAEKTKQFVT